MSLKAFGARALALALVLAPLASTPARSAPLDPFSLASRIHPREWTLPNGLRLYVQTVPGDPFTVVCGEIELSPAFDPPAKTGTGALAAALLADGGSRYDGAAERRIASALGAQLTFGASFGARGRSRDLDRLLDVLADAETAPRLAPDAVARERAALRAELAERDADPEARAEVAFARALYAAGDPVLREPTPQSVAAIGRADVVAYARRYFRPDRTTIVVAGDVRPDAVRAVVAARFGAWHNDGPPPTIVLPALPPTRRSVTVIPAAGATDEVRLGEAALGRANPDFFAANVLDAVLQTRLVRELEQRRGLVTRVSSALLVTDERGLLRIDLIASPRNLNAAVAGAKSAVRGLQQQPVPVAEWDRARAALLSTALGGAASADRIAELCETIARDRLPADYYATVVARYARVGPSDGLRVARRYLRDAYAEVYVVPLK